MKDKKLFGKFHDLILLLIGFGLTTIVGAKISREYQQREWHRQYEISKKDDQTRRSEEIYKNISTLMDYRLYRTRRLNWDNMSKDSHREFKEMLNQWNSHLNSNETLLETYFGTDAMLFFRNSISKNFRDLYSEIASADYSKSTVEKNINDRLDKLNRVISKFNLQMVNAIKNNNVGEYKKETIFK